MRTAIFSLFILLIISVYAQTRIVNPWVDQMQAVSDSAMITQYRALSDSLSRKVLTMDLLDSSSVESSRVWNLSHVVFSGWKQIVGNDATTYYNVDVPQDVNMFIHENIIVDCFNPLFAGRNKYPFDIYPVLISRNAPLNCVYIAYLTENIFIIRYVHSYPNGNMTSFFHEEVYYFVR